MSFHNLVDASVACMVALAALWWVASRRHWGVRCAVVMAIVLATLTASAYEPVVQYASGVVLIAAGMALYRFRQRDPAPDARAKRQVSLRDLLIFTALLSVVAAVWARMPEFTWAHLAAQLGIGVLIASVGLLALWIVHGRTPWRWRLPAAVLLFAAGSILAFASWGLWYWFTDQAYGMRQNTLNGWAEWWWFNADYRAWWFGQVSLTGLPALIMLCLILIAVKQSRWFGDACSVPTDCGRYVLLARTMVISPLLLMSLLLSVVLRELAHPLPIPELPPAPKPNGWETLNAAGSIIAEQNPPTKVRIESMSEQEVAQQLAKLAPVYLQIDKALAQPFRRPRLFFRRGMPVEHQAAVERELMAELYVAQSLRIKIWSCERLDDVDGQVAACHSMLRLATVGYLSPTEIYLSLNTCADEAVARLYKLRSKLPLQERETVFTQLLSFHNQLPGFSVFEEWQRIADENSGWMGRLNLLLDDWSGIDHYQDERHSYNWRLTALRLVLTEYALDLDKERHGDYTDSLEQLCPEFLPRLPIDPFSDAPLIYRRTNEGYLLYSVGPGQRDDGGQPMEHDGAEHGDITPELAVKY